MPPVKLVPPTIVAVRPSISYPEAPAGRPPFTRDMNRTAAIPTNIPLKRYAFMVTIFVLIPAALAASALPPTA